MNKYYTVFVKDLDEKNIGEKVTISGWVSNIRDHGGVLFLDLRDTTSTIQTVSNDDNLFKGLAKESVIRLEGTIRKRSIDTINEKLITGKIEILVENLEVLGESLHEIPFEIIT